MLHICPRSRGCANIKKERKMQEWQLTWTESRFLALTAEITEATTSSLPWAGGRNFTQPACLGMYSLYVSIYIFYMLYVNLLIYIWYLLQHVFHTCPDIAFDFLSVNVFHILPGIVFGPNDALRVCKRTILFWAQQGPESWQAHHNSASCKQIARLLQESGRGGA